jgi:hypothetical protein
MYETIKPQTDGLLEQRFRFRWAVLAAWYEQLRARSASLRPETGALLDQARSDIDSRSFGDRLPSALGSLEGALAQAERTRPDDQIAYWMDMLLASMTQSLDLDRLLGEPSVEAAYRQVAAN